MTAKYHDNSNSMPEVILGGQVRIDKETPKTDFFK